MAQSDVERLASRAFRIFQQGAVGSVLMGETIRAQHRGKAVGTVQAGWAIGAY